MIGSSIGGLREIIGDGKTGRLVPAADAEEFALVLVELIDNPDERQRHGIAAAIDVRERFAPELLLGAIQALYDEVLAATR